MIDPMMSSALTLRKSRKAILVFLYAAERLGDRANR